MKGMSVRIGIAVVVMIAVAGALVSAFVVMAAPVKSDYLKYVGSSSDLTSAWTEYTLCNPAAAATALDTSKSASFDLAFTTIKGELKNSWMMIRKNETYNYEEWSPSLKNESKSVTDNKTGKNVDIIVTSDKGSMVKKVGWHWVWKLWDKKDSLATGQCYNVRVYGTYPLAYGIDKVKIDNVLSVAGYKFDEFAWWNVSWQYRRLLNMSAEPAAVQIPVNITYDANMQPDFSDLRFSNNAGTQEYYYWLESKADSTWAVFWINNTAGDNPYVYYGNSSPVVSTSDGMKVFNFFDEGSLGNWTEGISSGGWVENSGAIYGNSGTAFSQINSNNPAAWAANLSENFSFQWYWRADNADDRGYMFGVVADGNWLIDDSGSTGGTGYFMQIGTGPAAPIFGKAVLGARNFGPTCGSYTITAGDFHKYRLDMNSTALSFSIDDVYQCSWADTTYRYDNWRFVVGERDTGLGEWVDNATAWKLWSPQPAYVVEAEETGSASSLPYSGVVLTPASPQTYPVASVKFDIEWNATGGTFDSAWLDTNITGTNGRWVMTNTSYTDYSITLPTAGAGNYNYSFHANMTDATSNSTSGSYVINKAAGTATLSSTAGWIYLTGLPTTISCTGTGVNQYVGYVGVTNPYTHTFAVGTYAVVCNVTATANYTAASDSKNLQVLPAGMITDAFDETSGAEIMYNLTMFNSSFSQSFTNLGMTFFALGNTSLPVGLVTLEFSSFGYGSRTYYRTLGAGVLENNSAYLLQSTLGNYVRFHTLTNTEVGIVGATVSVNRSIGGISTLVGQMVSDSTGTATFFLNPLVSYSVYATAAGYNPVSASITPGGATDFKLYMIPTGTINVSTQFYGVVWNFTPACGGITNSSTQFKYVISDGNSTLNSYGFNVTVNGTTYSVSGNTSTGSTLTLTLNLVNYSWQMVNITYWFNRTGFSFYSHTQGCMVWQTGVSNSLWGQLAAIKGQFCPMPAAGEIPWCLPLNIIALMVTMAVGAVGAARFGANGGGMAAAATLWVMTFLTWWPWQPALLLTLGMIGVVVLTRRIG